MSDLHAGYNVSGYNEAKSVFKGLKVKPGWTIFFKNRRRNRFDHIAIVMEQNDDKLNLYNARLLHSMPPGFGAANGPLSGVHNFSCLRVSTVTEYLDQDPDEYSTVIVGYPGNISAEKIANAGKIAKEIGITGLIDNRPAIFSFPILSTFVFIAEFDYTNHSVKRLMPTFAIKRKINNEILSTYCGDLVGRIYEIAGAKDLPKVSVLGIRGYKSTRFYEWQREHNTLQYIVEWPVSRSYK